MMEKLNIDMSGGSRHEVERKHPEREHIFLLCKEICLMDRTPEQDFPKL